MFKVTHIEDSSNKLILNYLEALNFEENLRLHFFIINTLRPVDNEIYLQNVPQPYIHGNNINILNQLHNSVLHVAKVYTNTYIYIYIFPYFFSKHLTQ